ncbi:MAG: DUF362 domain-containing protein [Holophagaceae bacterium]|nr:DUF362 domain-containing protein [Holophagaceae bacterium]
MDRRVFLQNSAGALGGLAVANSLSPMLNATQDARPDIAVAKGASADKIVRAAVDALGGIRRFISRGDVVVIKPNMGWDRTPELAANTNPDVMVALVKLCLEANAKVVKVLDRTSDDMRRAYVQSGIEAATKEAGAEVIYVGGGRELQPLEERRYRTVEIPNGIALKSWPILIDVLECDKLINVPIAKQHSVSKLTMTFKNLMGVMGDNRGRIHQNIDIALVDVATIVKPHLLVLDAVRILTAHGPKGGSLDDVKRLDTVIAGVDPVAIDSYGATLFGMTGSDLGFVKEASKRGLGQMDITKLNIKTIEV